ncbi:CorA family divalent cation transporter, partial [Pseudomonas sp. 32_A]|uniref:CorA family divalent cation transporter n=1 Tax=Pseudomonas sp. 32_A TaxID=2813559 RepID=UPI001A9E32D0
RYFPTLEALGAELEALEDRIFEKTGTAAARALIEDLYRLKRRLVMLQQHTAPLVEPLAKLVGGRVPQVCAGMDHYFRDVYDHLLRIVRTIEGRREMLVTAIQVNLGMISLAENEVTKRLGSFAALFAIPFDATPRYSAIARQTGNHSAERATGAAHGRHPIPNIDPCHQLNDPPATLTRFAVVLAAKQYLLALDGRT